MTALFDSVLLATRHGPMWGLRTDAYITRCLEVYGEYCEAEADVFRQLIKPGMTVVDLGTGVGYMLPHLSAAVGAGGSVIAEDIQQDFLDKAKAKARQEHLDNVQFVLGTDRDPRLTAGSADLILVLDAYHHFDYPEQMLARLSEALKPSGRLAIVEYYKRRGAMGTGDPDRAISHIRLDAGGVVTEVEANGFRLLKRQEHVLGSQYIAVFEKKRM